MATLFLNLSLINLPDANFPPNLFYFAVMTILLAGEKILTWQSNTFEAYVIIKLIHQLYGTEQPVDFPLKQSSMSCIKIKTKDGNELLYFIFQSQTRPTRIAVINWLQQVFVSTQQDTVARHDVIRDDMTYRVYYEGRRQ